MTEEINNMINKFCDSVEKRINQYELEKENAELKSYSQRMENQRENYYKEYLRLEQENKELRQQYNCYACDTCQGKEDYRNMKRHCENAIKIVHKYRSALEEIKNIVENLSHCKIPHEHCFQEDCSDCILDEIKKVLNDSEC